MVDSRSKFSSMVHIGRRSDERKGETMTDDSLTKVDWDMLPRPEDDGAGKRVEGFAVPSMPLPATDDTNIDLSAPGRTVVFVYPMTGTPGAALPEGWDGIPGARGCTPQVCAIRDLHDDMAKAGIGRVFGLSTQTIEDQKDAVERLHLPYPLLSDHGLMFADAVGLPRFTIGDATYLKRMTMVIEDSFVKKVFYPVFPPDRAARDVLDWLSTGA